MLLITRLIRNLRAIVFAIAISLALMTACTASSTVHAEASAQTSPTVTTTPRSHAGATPVPLPKVSYSTKSSNISRCQRTSDEVVLSYDDGVTNQKKLDSLLVTLGRNNIRAYFFFTGQFANAHPKMMKQIAAAGHVLGNHSYSHPLLTRLSDRAIKSQIARGVRGNTTMKLLRPPYGGGAFTPRLQKIARGMGYALCFWTVDTRDWDAKASPSAQTIVNRVIKGDKYSPPVKKGGVILMHGTSAFGVKATPAIIKGVKELGLRFPKLRS